MVLQTLESMGPLHGYGIARRIEQISDDLLKLNEGTVYASLTRLQHQRWISASWGASENNRKAKFYAITKAGRRQLATETDELGAHRGRHRSPPAHGGAALTCGRDWSRVFSRLGFAWARRRLDDETRREFDAHLDLLVEQVHPFGHDARRGARRRAAAVRQRDAGARGDLPDERHRVGRRAGAGSPLRVPAASTQPGLLGRRGRHARAGDRRHDGGVQRRPGGPARAAALRAARPARSLLPAGARASLPLGTT